MITATCATIAAILASAHGGDVITLRGTCPKITLTRKVYSPPITINATKAMVKGVMLDRTSGVIWKGGVIVASVSPFTNGPGGYGIYVTNATASNIVFDGVTVRDALKGAVINVQASNVTIRNSIFEFIGGDAINIASSSNITIAGNTIRNFYPNPGYHQDGIQMWNGAKNILIENNNIAGIMEGIVDFGTTGQPPVTNVTIRNNTVHVSTYHGITLWNATNSRIIDNEVRGTDPSKITQIHLKGDVAACGNFAPDIPKSPVNTPCR